MLSVEGGCLTARTTPAVLVIMQSGTVRPRAGQGAGEVTRPQVAQRVLRDPLSAEAQRRGCKFLTQECNYSVVSGIII